jgi:hypothetical protein
MTSTPVFANTDIWELLGDDPELLAISDAIAETQTVSSSRRRLPRGRSGLVIAAAVIVLVAAPAYAIVRAGIVDFASSPPSSNPVVEQFRYLDQAAPAGQAPGVIAAPRHVADFTLADGSSVALSVAPTKNGGFCMFWDVKAGTCIAEGGDPINLGILAWRIPDAGSAFAYGDVRSSEAVAAELRWPDGHTVRVPLIRVSTPINASFFLYSLHVSAPLNSRILSTGDAPSSASALDSTGKIIATSR